MEKVSVDIEYLKRTIERLRISFQNIAWANVSNYDLGLSSRIETNLEVIDYVIQGLKKIVTEAEQKQ